MIKLKNKLTKRLADSRGEKVITKKQFIWESVNDEHFTGNVSLMNIFETDTRWEIKREDGKEVCILGNGYKWLGVYPDNETYAITALYDDKNELVEFYFDMTKENGVFNGKPYIVDIYLDLVITPENEKIVLDEDELQDALDQNILGKEEFDLAYKTLDRVQKKYSTQADVNNLKSIMQNYLDDMLVKIKDSDIILKEGTM